MENDKLKILIVGRSGTGKDYLAKQLAEKGLKQVKSYTTRPKRSEDEDTHIFVTKEEAALLTDRVAETRIGEYEYFATREQVEESDIYIVDPKGYNDVVSAMPDTAFLLIHLTAHPDAAKRHAMERASDPEKEAAVYEKRKQDEDAEFSEFENNLHLGFANVNSPFHIDVENHYVEGEFEPYIEEVMRIIHLHENIVGIVRIAKDHDLLVTAPGGVWVFRKYGSFSLINNGTIIIIL